MNGDSKLVGMNQARSAALITTALATFITCSNALKVAAVQHVTVGTGSTAPAANAALYASDMQQAAGLNVSFIVFPEFGLLGLNFDKNCSTNTVAAETCLPLASHQIGATPCGDAAWHPVVRNLSCAAQDSRVFASVNMCERAANGTGFNTQVVFAADGSLAAVYRKMHPWMSKCFMAGPLHLVTFPLPPTTTPIGVFTCKDILYDTPGPALAKEGVRFFTYSAAIPLAGGGAEAAWSALYNATVVASNEDANQSGVFVAGHRLTPSKVPPGAERLLVADLPALG